MVREMTSRATARSKGSLIATLRAVLLSVTLMVALILGCLAIHALKAQSAPAGNASVAASATQAFKTNSDISAQHTVNGTAITNCADCGPSSEHLSLVMACVFALLALFFGLYLPIKLFLSPFREVRAGSVFQVITNLQARTPSLTVLCISRT